MKWHTPVMLKEVLEALKPQAGGTFIDATLGDGGHAEAVLERTASDGRLLGIERDPEMAERAQVRLSRFGSRARIVVGSYAELADIARAEEFLKADGILFDLGVASWHFEESQKGFSFRMNERLDMRFNPGTGEPTAAELVNRLSERELTKIFQEFGEEPEAKRIARNIIRRRPFTTTKQLSDLIMETKRTSQRGLHSATKVFQALRIAVNGELDAMQAVLPESVKIIRVGGTLAIIAYHSLEDRIVKNYFRSQRDSLEIVTKKPQVPTQDEIFRNPRARSAKLRIAIRKS